MPIGDSSQRDGHDHLLRLNSDDEVRYTGAPNRQALRNLAQQRRTSDQEIDDEMSDARNTNNSQDIIELGSKPKPTQSRPGQQPRTTSSHRSGDYKAPPKKVTEQQVLRQPSQPRETSKHTSQQIPAIRQTTQPTRSDSYTSRKSRDIYDDYDSYDNYDDSDTRNRRETQYKQRREYHWLVPTGITLIVGILCYLLVYSAWVGGKNVYNNLTYGSVTRTSNIEAVVGDHDSATSPTHFVALNLHGTIDIVEFPGGDVTHAKVFPGPHLLWTNADKAVATMEVKDVNGDKKPDLIIHVSGDTDLLFHQTSASFVLINNGSGFAPMAAYQ